MPRILRVSTPVTVAVGPFIDRGQNGVAAITGLSAGVGDMRIKKNGNPWGSMGSGSSIFSNEDSGFFYKCFLTAGDVDTLGILVWTMYALGSAKPIWHDFHVITTAAYNLHFNYPNAVDGGRITTDMVLLDHVSAANVLVSANVGQWRNAIVGQICTAAGGPNINVAQWVSAAPVVLTGGGYVQGDVVLHSHVTLVPSPTSAAPFYPADVTLWAHASVAQICTAAGGPNANVAQWVSAAPLVLTGGGYVQSDVVLHSHVTLVPSPTSAAPFYPADIVLWAHASVAQLCTAAGGPNVNVAQWVSAATNVLIAGRVDANVGAMQADTITNAALADATQIKANVVAWSDVTVQAITTANPYPSVDVVLWAHSSVSAMPGAPGATASNRVDVISWQGVTVQAVTTANPYPVVDVGLWAHTSVAAVVTAGWPQVEVASYAAGEAPLQPTVAGRKLDVSTGGEAGLDWANIGTPGQAQNLSGTTIGTIGAGGITAGSFAASAIDANALAADAVDEILDDTLEGATTVRQALRLILSALAGKLSGAATATVVIRDIGDTKNRITATVDSNGNRTAITVDGT